MKIALISCSKLKQNHTCTADEMYSRSSLFARASRYVSIRYNNIWFILSAKYGFLHPNTVIEPYDLSLNNMSKKEVRDWSKRVFKQVMELFPDQVDFYAGINYRRYLIPMLEEKGVSCSVPLEGLGIGKQLRYYKLEGMKVDNLLCGDAE